MSFQPVVGTTDKSTMNDSVMLLSKASLTSGPALPGEYRVFKLPIALTQCSVHYLHYARGDSADRTDNDGAGNNSPHNDQSQRPMMKDR